MTMQRRASSQECDDNEIQPVTYPNRRRDNNSRRDPRTIGYQHALPVARDSGIVNLVSDDDDFQPAPYSDEQRGTVSRLKSKKAASNQHPSTGMMRPVNFHSDDDEIQPVFNFNRQSAADSRRESKTTAYQGPSTALMHPVNFYSHDDEIQPVIDSNRRRAPQPDSNATAHQGLSAALKHPVNLYSHDEEIQPVFTSDRRRVSRAKPNNVGDQRSCSAAARSANFHSADNEIRPVTKFTKPRETGTQRDCNNARDQHKFAITADSGVVNLVSDDDEIQPAGRCNEHGLTDSGPDLNVADLQHPSTAMKRSANCLSDDEIRPGTQYSKRRVIDPGHSSNSFSHQRPAAAFRPANFISEEHEIQPGSPSNRPRSVGAKPEIITSHLRDSKQELGFRNGNLIRVEMINFLTFSRTVFKPGPRMNLIIGANGTGKSTIVSAICIVFGGSPNILGRSPDLASFVKYGEKKARIVAHIHESTCEKEYIAVRRDFDTEGRSTFHIDGGEVCLSDIEELIVKKYDIQLDNMSQFMPQEKIAEFTNHRPEELLKLAIRSLGGIEKEYEYADLVQEDDKLSNQTELLQKSHEQLEKLTAAQEQDRAEVEAYREQQKIRDEIDLFQRLRPKAEEIAIRFNYIDAVKEYKKVKKYCLSLQKLKQDRECQVNDCKQTRDDAKNKCASIEESIDKLIAEKDAIREDLDKSDHLLFKKLRELRDVHKQSEKKLAAVKDAERKLDEARQAYHDATQVPEEELQKRLGELEKKLSQLRNQHYGVRSNVYSLRANIEVSDRTVRHFEEQLQGLADVRRQRMERLLRMHDGDKIIRVSELVRRLAQDKEFERTVYGPVFVELEVREPYHARIMEHSVGGWLRTAFVLESMKDSRRLLAECAKHVDLNGYKPNTITTPMTKGNEIDYEEIRRQKPPFPVDDRLRQLGIVCTVSDIYQAPETVRAALNANARLYNVYVGNENARHNQEELRYNVGLPSWYTPDTRVQLIRSRYDQSARNLRVDTSFINVKGELYKGNITENQKKRDEFNSHLCEHKEKVNSYKTKLDEVKKEEAQIETDLRSTEAAIHGVTRQRADRTQKKKMVNILRSRLSELKEHVAQRNEAQTRNRLKQVIKVESEAALKNTCGFLTISKRMAENIVKHNDAIINLVVAEQKLVSERAKHEEASQKFCEKVEQYKGMWKDINSMGDDWKHKHELAKRLISKAEHEANREKLNKYRKLPLENLEKKIQCLQAKIDGMSATGRGVMDAYESREEKIKSIKQEINKIEDGFSARQADVTRRKQLFLNWLKIGIARMRSKFESLYRRLGCPADIRLQNMGGEHSLKDLTLEVRVSYRKDTELPPISATANSGGEKMCCTMIFCFSLQLEEERIPPFIMIDELNQGLDPDNEMNIMKMMIDDSKKEMGVQSFVVTLKLLPELPLGVCTKTHVVFNGHVREKLFYY